MLSVAGAARSRALVVVAAFCLAALALAPAAGAAKGGKAGGSGSTAGVLTLTSDSSWNSPNPAAPSWCLNEDDTHLRNWSGSIAGSFTTSERLCDDNIDYSGGLWWNAGGVGIQSDIYVAGTLTDAAVTSPDGASHHAVYVGSTSSRGVTTSHYQLCYVPPYSRSSNVGGTPLPGGTWQITVAGSLPSVGLSLRAHMMDATFQQQNCPPSEQNLVD